MLLSRSELLEKMKLKYDSQFDDVINVVNKSIITNAEKNIRYCVVDITSLTNTVMPANTDYQDVCDELIKRLTDLDYICTTREPYKSIELIIEW